MPKGRPRVPDELHKLRGTLRPDRHGDPSLGLGASTRKPTTPKTFDAEQRKIWKALQRELEPLGLWSATFAIVLELLVRAYVRYLEADEDVRKHGLIHTVPRVDREGNAKTAKMPDGKLVVILERKSNPAQREFTKLTKELRGLCGQMGLDPAALSRLRFGLKHAENEDSSKVFDLVG